MPSMYDPDTLPKVEQQRYYGPTRKTPPPGTERPRNMYTPQDYERHRPQMLQDTAAQFMTEGGGFDQEGFTKAAITNMYQAGDVKGVQEFTRLMKENAALDKQERSFDEDVKTKKRAGAEQKLKYLGAIVSDVQKVYETEGPEAANHNYQAGQRWAIKAGLLDEKDYEPNYDPVAGKQQAAWWDREYGQKKAADTAPYKVGTLHEIVEGGKKYQASFAGMDGDKPVWKNKQLITGTEGRGTQADRDDTSNAKFYGVPVDVVKAGKKSVLGLELFVKKWKRENGQENKSVVSGAKARGVKVLE